MSRLAASGLRPLRAEEPLSSLSPVPLLIDMETVDGLISAQSAVAFKRPLICLGPASQAWRELEDCIWMATLQELDGLKDRLALRRRSALRASETTLRQETLAKFGAEKSLQRASGDTSPRPILFAGEIQPQLIALKHELATADINLVACMSRITAQSYLEVESWSGLIIDEKLASTSVADWKRLLQDHAHLPVFALRKTDTTALGAWADIDHHLSWLGHIGTLSAQIASHLRPTPLTAEPTHPRLSDLTHDPATKLFTEAFFETHLDQQITASRRSEQPLTLLNLRLRNAAPQELLTLARHVAPRLRVTDMASRFGPDRILVSLRDTPYSGASQLARRLVNQAPKGLGLNLLWRACELRDGHCARDLIRVSLNGPYAKPVAA